MFLCTLCERNTVRGLIFRKQKQKNARLERNPSRAEKAKGAEPGRRNGLFAALLAEGACLTMVRFSQLSRVSPFNLSQHAGQKRKKTRCSLLERKNARLNLAYPSTHRLFFLSANLGGRAR